MQSVRLYPPCSLRRLLTSRYRLLSPRNPILPKLGAKFPFEVAVGMNGRVWVKAADGEEEKIIELVSELRGRP